MRDLLRVWNNLVGTYDAVNTENDAEKSYHRCRKNYCDRIDKLEKQHKRALTVAAIGLCGIATGIFIALADPYNFIFQWKVVLSEGGEIFEMWRKPPADSYLKVYLWNITNKDEYMSGLHDKLQLEEVGPYVYKELIEHDNVTFNENGTLTANPKHPLVWQPEMSEGRREDDLLYLPNIALLSIADYVLDKSFITKMGLNLIIRQTDSQPIVQMTAKEFMFGYSSPLMTLANQFMSSWIFFEKLGLIDRMYEFRGDTETIYTGQNTSDIKRVGLIEKYNGDTKLPQWDSPCGDIQYASDAIKFPSYIQPNDTLLFFRKSMCRAKPLVRVSELITQDGMTGYVYNFAPDADDNGKYNKNNTCFCKNKNRCLPPGLLDVRGCYYGFPIALSYPHFLDGDASLAAKVNGTNADPEKHKSYFLVNPQSGLPLNVSVKYQINMALGDISSITNTQRFGNMVLPLLWTDIYMHQLPSSLASRLRLYLTIGPAVIDFVMYASLISSPFLLLYALYKFLKSRTPYNSQWIEDDFVTAIDRKLSSYIPEKRASLTPKELEVYISTLSPLSGTIQRDIEA